MEMASFSQEDVDRCMAGCRVLRKVELEHGTRVTFAIDHELWQDCGLQSYRFFMGPTRPSMYGLRVVLGQQVLCLPITSYRLNRAWRDLDWSPTHDVRDASEGEQIYPRTIIQTLRKS